MTLRCEGTRPRPGVVPASGWAASSERSGPEVEVKFERGTSRIDVHGSCADGRPALAVEREEEKD